VRDPSEVFRQDLPGLRLLEVVGDMVAREEKLPGLELLRYELLVRILWKGSGARADWAELGLSGGLPLASAR